MLGHVDLPSKIALATPTTGNLYAIILDTAVRILHVTEEFVRYGRSLYREIQK